MLANAPLLKKILISDLLRFFLVPFWGEIARVMDNLPPNLVIVLEAFKDMDLLCSAEAAKQP